MLHWPISITGPIISQNPNKIKTRKTATRKHKPVYKQISVLFIKLCFRGECTGAVEHNVMGSVRPVVIVTTISRYNSHIRCTTMAVFRSIVALSRAHIYILLIQYAS
jgi:hypothetical protein